MNIKCDLIRERISDLIMDRVVDFEIDADKIADTVATKALSEIQLILSKKEYTDFEMIEKIVCIFEKYHLDFCGCHDFG
jgi:hypothetical protein